MGGMSTCLNWQARPGTPCQRPTQNRRSKIPKNNPAPFKLEPSQAQSRHGPLPTPALVSRLYRTSITRPPLGYQSAAALVAAQQGLQCSKTIAKYRNAIASCFATQSLTQACRDMIFSPIIRCRNAMYEDIRERGRRRVILA